MKYDEFRQLHNEERERQYRFFIQKGLDDVVKLCICHDNKKGYKMVKTATDFFQKNSTICEGKNNSVFFFC